MIEELVKRYPVLESVKGQIEDAYKILETCYENGGKLLIAGNGGSAADCEHIAGELLKSFKLSRPLPGKFREALLSMGEDGRRVAEKTEGGLPVVSLCGHPAFATAYANDKDAAFVYAQQICALGRDKDVLLAVSTSGNSVNCLYAVLAAKAKGMKTILLTGGMGGAIGKRADLSLIVPEKETYRVQELHLPVYHCICAMLENEFFS